MTNKDIAEELYRSFKSQVLWKEVDFKRILKFEKILNKRFDSKLKESLNTFLVDNGIEETVDTIVIEDDELFVADNIKDVINNIKKPDTLKQVDVDILQSDNIVELNQMFGPGHNESVGLQDTPKIVYELPTVNITDKHKRFRVQITFEFEHKIKEINFQTMRLPNYQTRDHVGRIKSDMLVVVGYIDTLLNRLEITNELKTYFSSAVYKIEEYPINIIPAEMETFWKNQTFL